MRFLGNFVHAIDGLNDWIGRGIAWLVIPMVVITFLVATLRYGFAVGWVSMQESYMWLYGIMFMVGAGYTLLHGGHVRVDVFYRPASARYKAWVDLFGSLFLMTPVLVMILMYSYPYVATSWHRLEGSHETGGLPGLFLYKSVILVFCVLMLLQGLSLAARSILVLAGHKEFEIKEEEHEGV
ncbi:MULTISPECIES: TRAP transporter small permease subunit [Thalassospira]|uniref:TRAP transporter small permease protein n=2 Tax=Thalassospira povalilytica TaxID=732237 RepID=A0A8I1SIL4_9PROT|nr:MULTISPECIES: TRAP transporter small permease subunit [Thalassospira]MEE3044510.1 TRAP transporter small permease subunit [Pseudomonadota bacterium]RCK24965.1 C4-dicarboxylate ABC transporter permease [Thalassospira profundimaris]KZB60734.1 C4-dicarboxylate ABC transporter permease [Thalassospira sp. MCCC 1A02491]MBN8197407.1 TRAP transporter small permease subunit [Thalassospira povalilytica]MBO6770990.1 TRAP transporter small permease subunit [Thalassospira sp.]